MPGQFEADRFAFILWARYELACEGHDLIVCKSQGIRKLGVPKSNTEIFRVQTHEREMKRLTIERAEEIGISSDVMEAAYKEIHGGKERWELPELAKYAVQALPGEVQ